MQVLKNNKGLSFIDLMVGMAMMMIGLVVLTVGFVFSNYSSSGTRILDRMGVVAGDVAEYLYAGNTTSQALEWAEDHQIVRENNYKVVLVSEEDDGITKVDITVGYRDIDDNQYEDTDGDEDEKRYRLSIFIN